MDRANIIYFGRGWGGVESPTQDRNLTRQKKNDVVVVVVVVVVERRSGGGVGDRTQFHSYIV